MPVNNKVNTVHPMLVEKADQIRRSRDCYRGTDAVKGNEHAGYKGLDETYLPKLSGQDNSEYKNYKLRALFYASMARTVTALVGAIDRKPPEVKGADHLEEFSKDVTGTGVSLTEFLKELETEIMISGRVIVCIDRMNTENNRPYLIWYKNEDCINWFTQEYSEFDKQMNRVVFRESYYKPSEDNPYQQIACDRYREFVKDDAGHVTVNIWTPESVAEGYASHKANYEITQTYNVHNRGKALGFLPVVPIVSEGSPLEVPKPPLIDLVDVNLSHYRNSADYEHGLHWTALPTPWFSGLNDRGTQISLGSGAAIALPDPSSKAGFLEFTGTGLKAILDSMKHKEKLMSSLGARMLSGGTMDQSTSAEVAKINVSGEVAALRNIAKSMSRGITRLLKMVSYWEGKPVEDLQVHLNEDYIDATLPAADVTALVAAYQAGAMSLDSLLWNLDQGERLPMSRTVEEEMALIEGDMENLNFSYDEDDDGEE